MKSILSIYSAGNLLPGKSCHSIQQEFYSLNIFSMKFYCMQLSFYSAWNSIACNSHSIQHEILLHELSFYSAWNSIAWTLILFSMKFYCNSHSIQHEILLQLSFYSAWILFSQSIQHETLLPILKKSFYSARILFSQFIQNEILFQGKKSQSIQQEI